KPRPLYLRLNVVPVSPTDTRFNAVPPSPTTHQSAGAGDFPLSPCSPAAPIPDALEMRRKRVAKLSRHLGENIPPELIPVPEAYPVVRSSQTQLPLKRSASVSPSQPVRRQDWVGGWNHSDMQEVQKKLRNLKAR
ncbi:hypothetical protein EDC04DRAFT_2527051, partial [Pisolithus marmoratus]